METSLPCERDGRLMDLVVPKGHRHEQPVLPPAALSPSSPADLPADDERTGWRDSTPLPSSMRLVLVPGRYS